MDWHCPGSPGLTVAAGGSLVTRAGWAIPRQVESAELFERFADGRRQGGLDCSRFTHRQARRELRGQGQALRTKRRDELLPGLDYLIEGE
jgi:hypothetical protein